MPSTYTLNNGIELIGTGEQSGTWGDTTNTNLGLLDAALDGQVTITLGAAGSSGSPNALPITDGTASNGRNRMVVFADGGDLGATAYVQLTPNDAEKIIYIRNSLSGSRSVILFQGTYNASNDYEVPAGTTAIVYFDGAGAGAVAANVFNNAYFDGLRLGSVSVTAILDEDNMASDSAAALATQQSIKAYVDAQVGTVDTLAEILAIGNTTGATDIAVDSAQKVQFRDAAIYINSSVDGQLDIVADTEIQIAATTVDLNGNLDVSGTLGVTGVLTATSLDISGDIDVDGTTNLDVVDIDGAVDMASTLLVTGVLTTTAATVHTGGITMPNNAKAIFGTGSSLEIYGDGSNSYIDDAGTGGLILRADNAVYLRSTDNENMVYAEKDGPVNLYHNNAQKLATTATGISVTGTVVAGAGTALLPSITTTGDLNTGMWFPAADTIAFSEGGVEALRIDSSGRVLIGATSSQDVLLSSGNALQLQGLTSNTSGISTTRHSADSGGPYFNFGKTRGTADGAVTVVQDLDILGQVFWSGADGTDIQSAAASIQGLVDGTPGVNDMPGMLRFSTTADGAATPTERMRIDSAGRVLINYADIPTGSGTNKGLLQVANSDTTYDWTQINTDANGYASTANEIAVINSANNDVNGFAGLFMQAGETTDGATISAARIGAIRAATSSAATDLAFAVRGGDSVMSEAMRIDSSQRVLIGLTTSEAVASTTAADLQVVTGGIGVSIVSTAGASGPAGILALGHKRGAGGVVLDDDGLGDIRFAGHDGTDLESQAAIIRASVDGTPGSNDMPGRLEFYTTADGAAASTERMRIDSAGRVGINAVPTDYNDYADGLVVRKSSIAGSSGITVQATANTGYSSLYFGDPDDTKVGGLEYNHNTDGMSVQSGNATTMFLDSSQRVLIGTSSSINGYHVQVAENSGYAGVSVLRYTTDAFGAYLNLGKSRTATIGGDTIVQDNDVVGYITFSPNDGTDLVSISSQIQGEIDGTPGANDMPGRLVFKTTADGASSSTERMRIDQAGNVIIPTAAAELRIGQTDSYGAAISLFFTSATENGMHLRGSNTSGSFASVVFSDGDGTDCGSIDINAGTNTTSYTTSSDYRLKEDVVFVANAASRLMDLKPVNFAWISNGDRVDGFLAHELADVVPEAVTGTKDAVGADGKPEYQGIDQSKLVPLLTAALQEALTKIETLEARITALENA
jgi:cytoskeletal protein CcmA (bactofilin family)